MCFEACLCPCMNLLKAFHNGNKNVTSLKMKRKIQSFALRPRSCPSYSTCWCNDLAVVRPRTCIQIRPFLCCFFFRFGHGCVSQHVVVYVWDRYSIRLHIQVQSKINNNLYVFSRWTFVRYPSRLEKWVFCPVERLSCPSTAPSFVQRWLPWLIITSADFLSFSPDKLALSFVSGDWAIKSTSPSSRGPQPGWQVRCQMSTGPFLNWPSFTLAPRSWTSVCTALVTLAGCYSAEVTLTSPNCWWS